MTMLHHNVDDWLPIIRAEYMEFPDMQLTRAQVQRLWNLDEATCSAVIELPDDANVATYVVKKSPGGACMMAKTVMEKISMSRGSNSNRLRTTRVTVQTCGD